MNGAVDVQRLTLFQDRFGGVDVGIQSLGSWSHVCERKNKNGYCLIENKSSDVFMRASIRLMMTQMCNTWTCPWFNRKYKWKENGECFNSKQQIIACNVDTLMVNTIINVCNIKALADHLKTKMAPQMAATVLCSSVFVLFLFVFPVFCFSNTISFTRDDLLNIRQNTPQNLLPEFDYSDILLDIVVGGAVALVKHYRTRRRGKRAGALVKLRQRGFRMPLPSIHLANLHSLTKKRTNSFCSPGQTRIFLTLLLCVSQKPG